MTFNSTTLLTSGTDGGIPAPASGVLATLGIATGLGAVAASSCCVIPLALGALGAGASVFGGLEAIAPWRVPLLVLSALAVAAAWGTVVFKRRTVCTAGSACDRPAKSRRTLALLSVATLVIALASGWNFLEPALLSLMRAR